MSNDHALLEELEQALDIKLKPMSLEGIITLNRGPEQGYHLDTIGHVTGLCLDQVNLKTVNLLFSFKHITALSLVQSRLKNYTPLKKLKKIIILYMEKSNVSDASFLRELKNLTTLYIGGNDINDASFLKELKNLTSLSIWYNNIDDISFLKELKNLTSLDISRNEKIKDYSFFKELKNLTSLDIRDNKISDASFFKELKNLTSLDIRDNKISDASFLRELKNLTTLHIGGNDISDVSFIKDLPQLKHVYLKGNPITTPPPEIVEQGLDAIRSYFNSTAQDKEKQDLTEVKILLVGDGGSGKTSLLNRLAGRVFDEQEAMTHGINIDTLPFECDCKGVGKIIDAHFWDFGGQEIMHASHKFFMSRRSLYILVLDGRKDVKEKDIDYWLKHIKSFGGGSPVMIVLNKIDEKPGFDINRKIFLDKYPDIIKGFYPVSCATDKGLHVFKQELCVMIPQIELLNTIVAASWFKVKEELERITKEVHYINHEQFTAICTDEGITDTIEQNTLIEFLNELGIVLHFHKLHLSNFHVLNPRWVTEAVYKIINSGRAADKKGIVAAGDLDFILNEEKIGNDKYGDAMLNVTYNHDEQRYILCLMQQFELCYPYNDEHYLIPDLLPENPPSFDVPMERGIRFIYEYEFLPTTIMSRFIIKLHKDTRDDIHWRTGIVLENDDYGPVTAVVKSDKAAGRIYIEVMGERKRDYFSVIKHALREINNEFPGIEIAGYIPLPGYPDRLVSYHELLGYERHGKTTYFSGELGKSFSVRSLLNGVTTEQERRQDNLQRRDQESAVKSDRPLVFISYAHADKDRADVIELTLERSDFAIKRDVNAIKYKGDITAFMKSVRDCDYVVAVVSDDFLRSQYCMFEMLELMKDDDFKVKIMPVRLANAEIFKPRGKLGYIKYWKKEAAELEAALSELGAAEGRSIRRDLDIMHQITQDIDGFMNELSNMLLYEYKTLQEAGFADLMKRMGLIF